MKKSYFVWVSLGLVLLLAACGNEAQITPPASIPVSPTTQPPTATHKPTITPTPALPSTATQTPTASDTPEPVITRLPQGYASSALTATPQTFVRENTPIPIPDEPITVENADQLVELARLGKGRIEEVQLSPNRVYLLVRTTIGVYGYLADQMEEVWHFEDPVGVAAMAVPRLERWIAVAMNDGRIALLIYQRGSMFTQWVTGYEEISDMAFSYDGNLLAAVGDTGVTVWEVGETEPLYKYPERGEEIHFTPDGESITLLRDGQMNFMSLETGKLQQSIAVKAGQVAYSVDGQRFTDRSTVWDANTGEVLAELEIPDDVYPTDARAFSQNGNYLAMGIDGEGTYAVGIWQPDSGELLFILKSPYLSGYLPGGEGKLAAPASLSGPDPTYTQIAFSPNGRMLAAAHPYGYVDLWNLETNEFMYRYSDLGESLIFRKDSRLLIWDELEFRNIEPRNGILINSARDFVAGRTLSFSPDGRWLFADWVVWEVDDLKRVFRFGDEIVAAISPDGEYLYSYNWNEHIIYQRRMDGFGVADQVELAWDYDIYTEAFYPSKWRTQNKAFSLSPDGNYFSTWIYDYGIQTWDVADNKIEPNLSGFLSTDSFFSPDGEYFAVGSDSQVIFFSLEPEIAEIHRASGYTCGFSTSSKHLLVSHDDDWYLYENQPDGELVQTVMLKTEMGTSSCGAFNQDETLLAGSYGRAFNLVDLVDGRSIIEIPAHLDEIASIAFSADGKYLATSSDDGTVKLWGVLPED